MAVKRGLIITATVLLVGLGWAVHRLSINWRAAAVRRSVDESFRQFDFAAAHDHLLAYLELRPTEANSHLQAARCARRAEFLENFRGPGPRWLELASSHLAAAERLGADAQAVRLERTLARVQRGQLAGQEGPLLGRVNGGGPDASFLAEALIQGWLRNLQCEKALVGVEALARLEPANVLALLWRGRIREQLRQLRGGCEDYERAIRLMPEFDAARYYLAENLLGLNEPREAEAHLRILNSRVGENLLVRLAWARCRIAMGDEATGRELLDSWLADAPRDHPRLLEALTARAGLALAQGRPAEAEGFARRALQESPLDRYALYDLAQSLNAQGRRAEAQAIGEELERIRKDLRLVARCRERLAKSPADLELRHEIGAAYLRVGRPGEALVWLRSVLDRDPNHLPTLRTLAELHARQGDQARPDQLRQSLARNP
jgi:predicted Zn-dependent protease